MDNIEKITKELLLEIGESPEREGLVKTPLRVSKSWKYLTSGYSQTIEDVVNGAIFSVENEDMIIVKDINSLSQKVISAKEKGVAIITSDQLASI